MGGDLCRFPTRYLGWTASMRRSPGDAQEGALKGQREQSHCAVVVEDATAKDVPPDERLESALLRYEIALHNGDRLEHQGRVVGLGENKQRGVVLVLLRWRSTRRRSQHL